MSESALDYSNSEFFRNRLVTRNLQPYNVEGAFQSSNSEPYYETNISDNSVIDSPNVNNEIFTEAQQEIIPNQYGPTGGFQDASGFINKTTDPFYAKYFANWPFFHKIDPLEIKF